MLLTCRAIGWRLEEELVEIERVVRAGGIALHLGLPHPPSGDDPRHRRLTDAGYAVVTYTEGQEQRTSYRKQLQAHVTTGAWTVRSGLRSSGPHEM